MNRKKRIEYSEKSWNPYTGCLNWYKQICGLGKDCWAYSMALRLKGRYGYNYREPFLPKFHPDKLNILLTRKKPTIWASCFMGDIGYCPINHLLDILNVVEKCPQHTFIFLTKMPDILKEYRFMWPDNVWLGVTCETDRDLDRIQTLSTINAKHRFVSFEPLRGRVSPNLEGIEGIAIGGLSGSHPYQPPDEYIKELLVYAKHFNCKVVIKDNLDFGPKLIEWP